MRGGMGMAQESCTWPWHVLSVQILKLNYRWFGGVASTNHTE